MSPRFHLAFPVADLEATRAFYVEVLGCRVGREDARWIDFDLEGHQITAHLTAERDLAEAQNPVDGDEVPVPHFGLVLDWDDWERRVAELEAAGVAFLLAPRIRFAGQPGEQATLFLRDPSGNAIELKAFRDIASLLRATLHEGAGAISAQRA